MVLRLHAAGTHTNKPAGLLDAVKSRAVHHQVRCTGNAVLARFDGMVMLSLKWRMCTGRCALLTAGARR